MFYTKIIFEEQHEFLNKLKGLYGIQKNTVDTINYSILFLLK